MSSGSFLYKMLDDNFDWTTRPYSPPQGELLALFSSSETIIVSHYKKPAWSGKELSFTACVFTTYLQARF